MCSVHFWSWSLRFFEEAVFALVDDLDSSQQSFSDVTMKFMTPRADWSVEAHLTDNITLYVEIQVPGRDRSEQPIGEWDFQDFPDDVTRFKSEFRPELIKAVRYVFDRLSREEPCHVQMILVNPDGSVKAALNEAKVPILPPALQRYDIVYTLVSSNTVPCGDGSRILDSYSIPTMASGEVNQDEVEPEEVKRDGHGRILDAYGIPVEDFPQGSYYKSAYAMAPENSTPGGRQSMRNAAAIFSSGADLPEEPVRYNPGYHEETDPEKLDRPVHPRVSDDRGDAPTDPNQPPAKRQKTKESRHYQKPRKGRKTRKK